MKWRAITTCNAGQWSIYGERMVASFLRYWPRDVALTIYAERFRPAPDVAYEVIDLELAAPWLRPWKAARNLAQCGITANGYRYRWDAAKFAHKIAAIGAAATGQSAGVLIWLDADTVTHSPVSREWLEAQFPLIADIAWLDRASKYPECGFMMIRFPQALTVIDQLLELYRGGLLFDLPEWHDSFAIEHVVKKAEARGEVRVHSLSGAGRAHHHVLANSPLATCLDHLKGARKGLGRTPPEERVVPGGGAYWQG